MATCIIENKIGELTLSYEDSVLLVHKAFLQAEKDEVLRDLVAEESAKFISCRAI